MTGAGNDVLAGGGGNDLLIAGTDDNDALATLSILSGVEMAVLGDNEIHCAQCVVLFGQVIREAANDFEGRMTA